MNKGAQLLIDMGKLWEGYGDSYLRGIQSTLILALVATALGCLIGFTCGLLNTIPASCRDHPAKRMILTLTRGGILSVDPGQREGARALGMNHFQSMTSVILPQALRNIMPQIGNNLIINIKDTSVMFIIGFPDFFAAHRAATGATYLYFPSALVEMAGYLTMTLIFSFILRWMEKKMDGKDSYQLAARDPLVMTAGTHRHPEMKEG